MLTQFPKGFCTTQTTSPHYASIRPILFEVIQHHRSRLSADTAKYYENALAAALFLPIVCSGRRLGSSLTSSTSSTYISHHVFQTLHQPVGTFAFICYGRPSSRLSAVSMLCRTKDSQAGWAGLVHAVSPCPDCAHNFKSISHGKRNVHCQSPGLYQRPIEDTSFARDRK